MELLFVAAGGAVGALARYELSAWVAGRVQGGFPWGTFWVNVGGCLLIGIAYALASRHTAWAPAFRPGVIVGMIGAFTTFSTFNYEILSLLGSRPLWAFVYLFGSIAAGLAAVWIGLHLFGGPAPTAHTAVRPSPGGGE